jgi:hypothetical protein
MPTLYQVEAAIAPLMQQGQRHRSRGDIRQGSIEARLGGLRQLRHEM